MTIFQYIKQLQLHNYDTEHHCTPHSTTVATLHIYITKKPCTGLFWAGPAQARHMRAGHARADMLEFEAWLRSIFGPC
jgi:hypothetical protein